MRRNIYEIIVSNRVILKNEYDRIYKFYFIENNIVYRGSDISLNSFIEINFRKIDTAFIRRTTSLKDFNMTYGFSNSSTLGYEYVSAPEKFSLEFFIKFCEYIYNFTVQARKLFNDNSIAFYAQGREQVEFLYNIILSCLDELGYVPVQKNGIFIFCESSPQAVAVAETVDEELSIRVFEYNHYRLKGNLEEKLSILKAMADNIEPQRDALNSINQTLTSNLFQLLNKFVRHNNSKNVYISTLSPEEIEECYDDIYQMWLLAKLELDNVERSRKVKKLLGKINS